MSQDPAPDRQTDSDAESLDVSLIVGVQAYLDALARRAAPSPEHVDAWNRFYGLLAPIIRRNVRYRAVAGEDWNDCVQDVWQEVIIGLHRLRRDSNRTRIRGWLRALARNKSVDLIRRKSRMPTMSLNDVEDSLLSVANDSDPAILIERDSTRQLVREVFAEFSRGISTLNLRVLELRWFEGRTPAETAEILALTPAQVRFRHHRLKVKLRGLLKLRGESPSSRDDGSGDAEASGTHPR